MVTVNYKVTNVSIHMLINYTLSLSSYLISKT